MKGDALLEVVLYKKLVRVVDIRGCLGCSKHKMVEFRILTGESKTNSRVLNLNLEEQTLPCSAWANAMECGPGENEAPGELVDFQGTLPPGSMMVYPAKQEIEQRWEEACVDKQGTLDKTHKQKKKKKKEYKRWKQSGDPGGLYRCYLSMQEWA